jgi:hypothetical protein
MQLACPIDLRAAAFQRRVHGIEDAGDARLFVWRGHRNCHSPEEAVA